MAETQVTICNSALIKIGASPILSIDDPVKEAKTCKVRFESAVKAVLRSHPWNCVTKRVILAPLTTGPAFGFANQFQLPSDFLRNVAVNPGYENDAWKIEGRILLSDDSSIELKYVYYPTDLTVLDQLCCEAISAYLAFDICFAITQSVPLRNSMWELFNDVLKLARSVNAKENPLMGIQADEFLDSRRSEISEFDGRDR